MTSENLDFFFQLAISPDFDHDGLCLAACDSGLRRSTDGGNTWQAVKVQPGLPTQPPVTCVAFSPAFRQDRLIFAGTTGSLLQSSDGGETWQVFPLPTPPPTLSSMLISPNYAADGSLYLAATEDGVFLSTDRGATFGSWNFGLFDPHVFSLVFSADDPSWKTLHAGTESGIFRSTNGGKTWVDLNFPLEWAPVLQLAALPGGILIAGTEQPGAFISPDEGNTWQVCAKLPADIAIGSLTTYRRPNGSYGILLAVGNQIHRSQDHGKSWSRLPVELHSSSAVSSLAVHLHPEREDVLLVAADDIHVIRSRSLL